MTLSELCCKTDDEVTEHVEMSDSSKDPEQAPGVKFTLALSGRKPPAR